VQGTSEVTPNTTAATASTNPQPDGYQIFLLQPLKTVFRKMSKEEKGVFSCLWTAQSSMGAHGFVFRRVPEGQVEEGA